MSLIALFVIILVFYVAGNELILSVGLFLFFNFFRFVGSKNDSCQIKCIYFWNRKTVISFKSLGTLSLTSLFTKKLLSFLKRKVKIQTNLFLSHNSFNAFVKQILGVHENNLGISFNWNNLKTNMHLIMWNKSDVPKWHLGTFGTSQYH